MDTLVYNILIIFAIIGLFAVPILLKEFILILMHDRLASRQSGNTEHQGLVEQTGFEHICNHLRCQYVNSGMDQEETRRNSI